MIMVIFSFANIIEETPNTLIPFAATKKYPKSCENSPNVFPKAVIYPASVISLIIMVYLAVQLFLTMDVASRTAVIITYADGYVYMFFRSRYLKKKEGYDLIRELADPYEPWEEQERSYTK